MLESTRQVDTIVLDKIRHRPRPAVWRWSTSWTPKVKTKLIVLAVAGALEHASEHPIAQAIAAAAQERTGALAGVEEFANLEGLGVRGMVDGHACARRS